MEVSWFQACGRKPTMASTITLNHTNEIKPIWACNRTDEVFKICLIYKEISLAFMGCMTCLSMKQTMKGRTSVLPTNITYLPKILRPWHDIRVHSHAASNFSLVTLLLYLLWMDLYTLCTSKLWWFVDAYITNKQFHACQNTWSLVLW